MSVIEARNLTKAYGRLKAVTDLSFAVEENTITGLIGRNGAGKTTLLKLIAGYLKPTRGEIAVFGQAPFNNLNVAANMIFVDDNMVFPDSLNLMDILEAAPSFYPHWDRDLAQKLFRYFDLNPRQHHSRLSKGTKSLFNALVGIASRSPLSLFDEPTTGMDSAFRKDFYRALLKDYLAFPRTIILSSHLLSEIEEILEDILLLDEGRKVLHLPVTELKEWAVGLRGSRGVLAELLPKEAQDQVLHQEHFAGDQVFMVVKRELIGERLPGLKHRGIEVLPVSADDLCVYLTKRAKGGIDDVFHRS